MNRDHERNTPPASHGRSNASEPSQRVRVDHRNLWFARQRPEQIKRHQIAANGNEFLLRLPRNSPNRQERPEPFDDAAGVSERISGEPVVQPRTINHGRDVVLTQPLEQSLDGGFGAPPFGRVTLAQEVNHTHGYFPQVAAVSKRAECDSMFWGSSAGGGFRLRLGQ